MKIKLFTIESDFTVPMFRAEVRDKDDGVIMIHESTDIRLIRDSIVEIQQDMDDISESVVTMINEQEIDSAISWEGWFFFLAGRLAVS